MRSPAKVDTTREMVRIWIEDERDQRERLSMSELWGRAISLLAGSRYGENNHHTHIEPIPGMGDE